MEKPPRIARDPQPSVAERTQVKADLRTEMLAKRRAVCKQTRELADASIQAALLDWCAQHRPRILGVYYPINGEPDLQDAYAELVRRGVRLALPVVVAKAAPLSFAAWTPGEHLEKGSMGVPTPGRNAERLHPDAVVAPCIAFNAQCYRIGYGGGYYDRTLSVPHPPLAAGIAYAHCRAEFTPDDYDAPLDAVLTEAGIILPDR